MKGKKGIITLAVVIAALCIWHLSFTVVSRHFKNEAEEYAQTKVSEAGSVANTDSLFKESAKYYKDSLWKQEVYLGYTLEEIRKLDLSLGLDLQGGMHVTLEVAQDEIIEGLCNAPKDEAFQKALESARELSKVENQGFASLIAQEYAKAVGTSDQLWALFQSPENEDVQVNATDEDVVQFLENQLDDAIDRAVIVLRNRIDEFGASQPIIQPVKSTGRIEIELPGADNEERIVKKLKSVAQLEFLEVYEANDYFNNLLVINQLLIANGEKQENFEAQEAQIDSAAAEEALTGETELTSAEEELGLTNEEDDSSIVENLDETEIDTSLGNEATETEEVASVDTNTVGTPIFNYLFWDQQGNVYALREKISKVVELFQRPEVKEIFPPDMVMYRGTVPKEGNAVPLYFLRKGDGVEAALTGDYIEDATQDFDPLSGRVVVSMSMDPQGSSIWERVTELNINKRIAVCLDNIVYSAPVVNQKITGGRSQISGGFDIAEAQDLANILRAGKLPAPTRIERMVNVGPSLGAEAINRGLFSLVAGLVLVVLFMVMYYSKGGMVADIALLFNLFLILGIFAMPMFEAALTLPGIAGIVLTIGMSIDANVLIFERIKEEMRDGKGVMNAISEGYSKAFWTIFDANATTLATALILMSFGTGLVKGFAITLMIGIFCSFFSAVFITRIIIEAMAKKNQNISFETGLSKKIFKNLNTNFLSKRKAAYIFSLAIILVGGIVMMTKGLNLGVSFTGGHSYIVKFDSDVVSSDIRSAVKGAVGDASVEVKSFDGADQVQITTSYMKDSEDPNKDEMVKETVMTALSSYDNPQIMESIVVGASIAEDIKSTSMVSMILSLVIIFIYILIRFRKAQFSLGALIALIHDVLFVLATFAICGLVGINFEIDEVFIAAVLTIVGYSINDTVVVFDRVREYLGLSKTGEIDAETLNKSINSTMSRTIMTSVTTLIVVLVLLVFGGEALRGFSFALFIGVLIGTYSSIFIATPVVLDSTMAKKKLDK